MQCTNCNHHPEDPEALFCTQCGKPIYREGHCLGCGKPFQPDAKFCDRCGAPAGATADDIAQLSTHPIATQFPRSSDASTGHTEYDEALKQIIDQEVKLHVAQARKETLEEQGIKQERSSLNDINYGFTEDDWVTIPAGSFLMGSPESELDRFSNERRHQVQVDGFQILKTPVTFGMFDLFCDEVRHSKPADETWGREKRPVINVSYWSAMEYCYWLSKRCGCHIRLPTEAEWEYACRADTTTPFWTGEIITTEQANFDGNCTYAGSPKGVALGRTSPVDSYPANPWGLHDMHGNVWEWCASVFDEDYNGLELEDAGDDQDELRERVVRGGSWHNVPGGLRSASRNKLRPNYHYLRVGFRLIREIRQ
jgi:formylglycine-generating enzyme required for sulfatase activity